MNAIIKMNVRNEFMFCSIYSEFKIIVLRCWFLIWYSTFYSWDSYWAWLVGKWFARFRDSGLNGGRRFGCSALWENIFFENKKGNSWIWWVGDNDDGFIEIEDGKPTERSARSRSSADTEYFLVSYRFPFYIALRLWEWWLWWGWWFSLNMFGLQLPSKLEHYKKLWEERCNLCPLESCKSPFLPARQDGVKWSNIKNKNIF